MREQREGRMKWVRQFANRASIVRELLVFLWLRKLWWLIPLVALLVVVGLLLLFAQSSPVVAPFVYTLF